MREGERDKEKERERERDSMRERERVSEILRERERELSILIGIVFVCASACPFLSQSGL